MSVLKTQLFILQTAELGLARSASRRRICNCDRSGTKNKSGWKRTSWWSPAFVLWKTLAQLCQRAGLGNEPRKVFQELADITLVDVVLPTRNGVIIRKRCISRPTEHQAILLQDLNLYLPNSLEMAQV